MFSLLTLLYNFHCGGLENPKGIKKNCFYYAAEWKDSCLDLNPGGGVGAERKQPEGEFLDDFEG